MRTTLIIALMLIVAAPAMAIDATFEDVPLTPESFYNGDDLAGGFASGSFVFNNNFYGSWWEGWSVSNTTDITTPGYILDEYGYPVMVNEFSAYSIPGGGGAGGSSNYGVAWGGYFEPPIVALANARIVDGAYFTNTTYAYLSMLNGDDFGKEFGGTDGTDEDWFLLTITGKLNGAPVGAVEFYLADLRFAESGDDYIVDEWTWVDLSVLGTVDSLEFDLDSSDKSYGYLNTPAYFAMDNLVPGPASAALLLVGMTALVRRRRRG